MSVEEEGERGREGDEVGLRPKGQNGTCVITRRVESRKRDDKGDGRSDRRFIDVSSEGVKEIYSGESLRKESTG